MRLPQEVLIVVRRGGEVLVAHRSPEHGAYWHALAGGVEAGETAAEAARRELREEAGLDADPGPARHRYEYPLAEAPEFASGFPPGTAAVSVSCFLVDAPAGWEPTLDEEHDAYRWCTAAEARALMRWADAADAVARLACDYA